MTQIRHRLLEQMLSQQLITRAELRYAPTRPAKVAGGLLLPSPKVIGYSGTAGTIDLEPCDGQAGWCWELTITIEGTRVGPLYVLVPTSGGVVELEDLVQVDPRTLTPTGGDLAAWQILLAEVRAEVAGLPDDARKINANTMSFTRDGADVFTPITLPAGPQGAASTVPGPAGTITSMSATGLAAGAAPTVTLGGTASARTIALGIPAGATGPGGTITAVTVTPLAPGAEPTITLGGTATARTIALGIPRGEKGDPGDVTGATWAGLPDKPATFAPAPHSHLAADLPAASSTAVGLIETATSAEVITGTDAVRAVTPATLVTRTATEARIGLVELASPAEVATGTDTARAVTPAGLASRVATAAATGLVELATNDEAIPGVDPARAVTPATLAAVLASRNLAIADPIALFLGNSHTTETGATSHWPQILAASMAENWTVKNYAISGTGFSVGTSTTKYAGQLATAVAAMTAAERARVRYVFPGDMSNDVRNGVDPATIKTEADALWTSIKAAYPLARIVCLPILWGTDTTNSTQTNRSRLGAAIPVLRESCLMAGVEHIEGSWTWHWGRTDLQDTGDIHFTAAGKTWIAAWMARYLRGDDTWYDRPATALSGYGNSFGGYASGGWQGPTWEMKRGSIIINGAITRAAGLANLPILLLPVEARPPVNAAGLGCEAQWGSPGNLICTLTTGTVGTIAITYSLL